MNKKHELFEILKDVKRGNKMAAEAYDKILLLFNVVGQSEQYFCCKDQIKQRCGEQCLGCYMYANDKV